MNDVINYKNCIAAQKKVHGALYFFRKTGTHLVFKKKKYIFIAPISLTLNQTLFVYVQNPKLVP